MTNYLSPKATTQINNISVLGLAHIGDAVYELMVRTWLCDEGTSKAKNLHNKAITFVSAKAQAIAAEKIKPVLTEEEAGMFKRGRNSHVNTTPKASTIEEYHLATGLEALFGYLYLTDNIGRLNELFDIIIKES